MAIYVKTHVSKRLGISLLKKLSTFKIPFIKLVKVVKHLKKDPFFRDLRLL